MAILISIGILVLLTVLAAVIYWATTRKDASSLTLNDGELDLKNSVKKHAVGDTNSYRRVAFFSGLFITLLFVTILIEYKEYEIEEIFNNQLVENIEEIFDIPITDMPPPPPPKIVTPEFVEVEDEEIIEEEKEIIIDQEEVEEAEVEDVVEDVEEEVIEEPVIFAEEAASFQGGQKELFKYVYANYNYPQRDIDEGNAGTIYVKFVVEKDGSLTGARILRGINERLDKEALRVVKSMPRWKPARNGGRKVRMFFQLPIRLKIK